MADELLAIADRPKYYRALAAILRARIPFLQAAESRRELASLAADYDSLAGFVDANLPSEKLRLAPSANSQNSEQKP